jgi:hypothetical protein
LARHQNATKTPPKHRYSSSEAITDDHQNDLENAPTGTSDDLCGGLKRSLKIIGGGLEDFWWRFGGVDLTSLSGRCSPTTQGARLWTRVTY